MPENKIEPKLVGNGVRVGAFATEDLDVNNVYIALPANSVIDVNTALADADKSFWAPSQSQPTGTSPPKSHNTDRTGSSYHLHWKRK